MFESLTEKFNSVFKSLAGRGRITEANISDAMRDVRKALLEADVSYNVVKQFCKDVTRAAIGAEIIKSLHPGQVMVKIVSDELTKLMGPVDTRIYFVSPGPTVIMLAGLQGCGKTTTAAKLAKYLVAKGKRPLMVADDLQRPAAVEQLDALGQTIRRVNDKSARVRCPFKSRTDEFAISLVVVNQQDVYIFSVHIHTRLDHIQLTCPTGPNGFFSPVAITMHSRHR